MKIGENKLTYQDWSKAVVEVIGEDKFINTQKDCWLWNGWV